MAKLNVTELADGKLQYNGAIYEKADYPIQKGDIVQAHEWDCDITDGGFYEVTNIESDGDFNFIDDEGDERYRNKNDSDFVPYRKVSDASQTMTITLTQPVHLVITNIASIELKTE